MAEKQSIALEFALETDKANLSLGELEKGFETMKDRLKEVGRGSDEFKQLTTAMAETGREVKNIELGFEALDNEQVASELGSVAGAVGDVTAAFVLMGGENETMEEMAKGIETAMAISIGFKGAIEGVSSGMKLYNNLLKTGKIQTFLLAAATKVAAVAQGIFNAIMSANPIAIVVLALAAVVTAMIAFGSTVMDVIKSALAPFQFAIDMVVEALKWLGIMESDSAKATRLAEEEKARVVKEKAKERVEAYEREAKAHKKATEEKVANIDFEIRKLTAAGRDFKKLADERLQLILDAAVEEQRLHEEGLKRLDEQNKANAGNALIYIQNFNKKIDIQKKLTTAQKTETQTRQDIEVKELKDKKAAADAWAAGQDERDRIALEKEKAKNSAKFEEIGRIEKREIEAIDTKIAGIEKVAEVELLTEENLLAEKQRIARENEKLAEEADERRQKQLDLAQGGLDILGAGADAFIKDEVKREKVKKKLAIAQMAIDSARAISSVVAAAASTSITPIDLAIKVAAGIATVLANIAQAKALLGAAGNTSAGSLGGAAGGASAGGGGAQIDPVSNTSTVIGEQNMVVGVTEVTHMQKKVDVIEESATF